MLLWCVAAPLCVVRRCSPAAEAAPAVAAVVFWIVPCRRAGQRHAMINVILSTGKVTGNHQIVRWVELGIQSVVVLHTQEDSPIS